MITDNIKWHYLALKSISTNDGFIKPIQPLSRLFNKIISTNTTTDSYCLNCFKSYSTESKLEEHESICDNLDHCETIMPDEKHKILKYLEGSKSIKMEHVIYLDLECVLSKHNTCANNPNNSYSKTISTHDVSGYSIVGANRQSDNYQMHYRGEDCTNKLACELMTIGKEIAKNKKKDEEPLTDYENSKYEQSRNCHICHRYFITDEEIKDKLNNEYDDGDDKDKDRENSKKRKNYENFKNVKDYGYYTRKCRGPAHKLCNSRYQEQRNIPVIIHNGSNYDFHLIIKELAKKIKSKMRCIGENTETYKTFSVEFQKDEEEEDNLKKARTYRLRSIDSCRFIKSPLDKLADNLSEINNNTCNKCKERTRTTQYCEFVKLHENRLMHECLNCKNISFKPINSLISKFSNTYKLCSDDNKKFVLLLRKCVYQYEYMDNWNRFNETSLPSKKNFTVA